MKLVVSKRQSIVLSKLSLYIEMVRAATAMEASMRKKSLLRRTVGAPGAIGTQQENTATLEE